MEEYHNLKFATLFHDIGKFYQRAYENEKSYDERYDEIISIDGDFGKHSKWSADFVKKYYNKTIENLVLNHHNFDEDSENSNMIGILHQSNYHPLQEGRISEKKAIEEQLISVFSKIKLPNVNESDLKFVPLQSLKLDDELYPNPHKSNLDYKSLWDEFIAEFETIQNVDDFETVFALVKKYTSTIPLATYENEEEISLFDHLKTSVCLANCIYLYTLENPDDSKDEKYTVINGDISGIQDFIYRVSSPDDAQKDMSKRLRGRSLYLSLLCESITSRIIDDLRLDSSNVLFCGGGRFTIIAPNTNKTKKIIDEIDCLINNFFINEFNAELYLAVEFIDASNKDFKNFNNVLSKLNNKLSENKKHKFKKYLDNLFKERSDTCHVTDLCHVCGKPTSNESFCDSCNEHVNLGAAIANARYMIKYTGEKIPGYTSFHNDLLNVGFIFLKDDKIPDLNSHSKFVVYSLNDTDFLKFSNIQHRNISFDFKFIGNNVPNIDKNRTLYFEHLAQCSKGSNKLGVLKMDVDNLGKIFSQGFNHLDNSNISRISSLSFNMDLFFSGFINSIVEEFKVFIENENNCDKVGKIVFEDETKFDIYKPDNRNNLTDELNKNGISTIYINYSGGDDLLVVGPYDDVIEFAQKFRNKFKEWTCNNDSINISAGIKVFGPKFPIGKAAIMADEDLEKSKGCGRNKITLFNQILAWESDGQFYKGFDSIFSLSKKLEELRENGKLSGGFVYSLLHMWEFKTNIGELQSYDEDSWLDFNKDKQTKKSFIPLLYYKLRIIKDPKLKEELLLELKESLPWIRIPVSWSSLRLR